MATEGDRDESFEKSPLSCARSDPSSPHTIPLHISFTLDLEGIIQAIDAAGWTAFGYSTEAGLDRSLITLFHRQDQARLLLELRAIAQTDHPPYLRTHGCLLSPSRYCIQSQLDIHRLHGLDRAPSLWVDCTLSAPTLPSAMVGTLDQIQQLNVQLEDQVRDRTDQLQRALSFEALVRQITAQMRDSLEEGQILQAVTHGVAQALNSPHCMVELYNPRQTTATIAYEYTDDQPVSQGWVRSLDDFRDFYIPLLQGQSLQFSELVPTWLPESSHHTQLACPIFDDQGILGNVWLVRSCEEVFDEQEVQLVQQVADQCAIAIRQARLYETAQSQVRELERLVSIKDEFLTSISHELRTPMSSLHLGTQTLEKLVRQKGALSANDPMVIRTLRILQSECQREIRLIDNLLTLSYAEGGELLSLVPIDLARWLTPHIDAWRSRMEQRQQIFCLAITTDIPSLKTDVAYLQRIITELMNNACRYTPSEQTITLRAWADSDHIHLAISNSGVELSSQECDRVFEKFYRLGDRDLWEHGGAGLGLAVVKKLAERLQATIHLTSELGQTTFTVTFPR